MRHLELGAVMVEMAIGIVLMIAILFGIGELLSMSLAKLSFEENWTQIQLGPQTSPVIFIPGNPGDPSGAPPIPATPPSFHKLSDTTSIPGSFQDNFFNTVFNHFTTVDKGRSTLFLSLGYFGIDPSTGGIDGSLQSTIVRSPQTISQSWCNANSANLVNELRDYTESLMTRMKSYGSVVSAPPTFGNKLLEINVAGATFQRYVPMIVVMGGLQCRNPTGPIFGFRTVSKSMTIPRNIVQVYSP